MALSFGPEGASAADPSAGMSEQLAVTEMKTKYKERVCIVEDPELDKF
jgi:hypothetical protein